MTTWVIAFVQVFFVINTISFYLLSGIADQMIDSPQYKMSDKELSIYKFLRIGNIFAVTGIFVASILALFIK